MESARAVAKSLVKTSIILGVPFVCFRFLGDFSLQQSGVLTAIACIGGYGVYEALKASRAYFWP